MRRAAGGGGRVLLDPRRVARCTELADSKMLTAPVREQAYQQVLESALSGTWS